MKKQILTNKKQIGGITLIALVITIIVLLILAAVSIATLTGENGILTKASDAKTKTEIADVKERVQTDILGVQAENENGDITKGKLVGILEKYFEDVPTAEKLPDNLSELELTTREEYGSHIIKISDIWNGTFGGESNKTLAKDVLKTDTTATDAASKSPYVKYNGLDCRVLYNDETHALQIITAESVEDVTLGYGDTEVEASDFTYDGTANADENFKKAATSYNNVVDNLNKRAKIYMDEKGIATDARCLGSISTLTSDSKFQGDTSGMWSGIDTYLETYSWNNKFKNTDTNYSEDVKQLNDLELNVSSGRIWLASRYVYSRSDGASFRMRTVDAKGGVGNDYLCYVDSGGAVRSIKPSYGFRPVFLLPFNVTIISGDGSSKNPYVIE